MEENIYDYLTEKKIPEDYWWHQVRNNLLEQVLKNSFNDLEECNKKILDIGSGFGQLLPVLAKFGNVYSIESNKSSAEYQKNKYKQIVIWNTEYPSEKSSKYSYDLICMCDFLEHIQNPAKILLHTYQILNSGGLLLITVPAYQWMWSDFDLKSGHFKRYLRKELIDEAKRAGFQCVYSTYFMTILFLPAIILRKFVSKIRKTGKEANNLGFVGIGNMLNKILHTIFNVETLFIRRKVILPFGLSILCVFKKF